MCGFSISARLVEVPEVNQEGAIVPMLSLVLLGAEIAHDVAFVQSCFVYHAGSGGDFLCSKPSTSSSLSLGFKPRQSVFCHRSCGHVVDWFHDQIGGVSSLCTL